MTPDPITVTGAKGGQGTTTIAAAIALRSANTHRTLLIDTTGDALAVLGHPTTTARPLPDAVENRVSVLDTLDVVTVTSPVDAGTVTRLAAGGWQVVVDTGTTWPDLDTMRVLVLRNCYLALRRAVTVTPDRLVAVLEPHRALTAADITVACPRIPLTTMPADPAVARTVDAGLLTHRLPHRLTVAVDGLLARGVRS